jgi:hypothetical protein
LTLSQTQIDVILLGVQEGGGDLVVAMAQTAPLGLPR